MGANMRDPFHLVKEELQEMVLQVPPPATLRDA